MAASSSSLSIVSLLLADHDHRPPSRSMDVVTNPNEFDDFGKVTCTEVRSRPTRPSGLDLGVSRSGEEALAAEFSQ